MTIPCATVEKIYSFIDIYIYRYKTLNFESLLKSVTKISCFFGANEIDFPFFISEFIDFVKKTVFDSRLEIIDLCRSPSQWCGGSRNWKTFALKRHSFTEILDFWKKKSYRFTPTLSKRSIQSKFKSRQLGGLNRNKILYRERILNNDFFFIAQNVSLTKEIPVSYCKHDDKNEPRDLGAADLREVIPNIPWLQNFFPSPVFNVSCDFWVFFFTAHLKFFSWLILIIFSTPWKVIFPLPLLRHRAI